MWVTRKRLIDYVNARRAGTATLDKALDGLIRNAEVEVRSEQHRFNKTTARWYRLCGPEVMVEQSSSTAVL